MSDVLEHPHHYTGKERGTESRLDYFGNRPIFSFQTPFLSLCLTGGLLFRC